jgi:hypothetical protein
MDDEFAPRPIAGWYMPAAVASLLFMGLGCVAYIMHVLTDPASLSFEQRTAFEALPAWVLGAQAVAVWIGLVGTVLMMMRKKLAEAALLVSLIAVLVWLAGLLLTTEVRESMSANDLLVAIVVTALTWTIFWFARHSRQRGWLR